MLFVSSSPDCGDAVVMNYKFQSRNRDAFRFKLSVAQQGEDAIISFNLGIEMLFVSSGLMLLGVVVNET